MYSCKLPVDVNTVCWTLIKKIANKMKGTNDEAMELERSRERMLALERRYHHLKNLHRRQLIEAGVIYIYKAQEAQEKQKTTEK